MADPIPGRVLRLFLSAPSFAEDERRELDRAVAAIGARFGDDVGLEAVLPGAAGAADCDAVLAVFRASPPPGYQVGDQPAGGGAAGMLSAIGGRAADAKMPDIFIFRHVEGGADDPDWENRQGAFRAWFQSRGGIFLDFEDYSDEETFGIRLIEQLQGWLEREGYSPKPEPVSEPEPQPETAPEIEPPPVEEPS